MILNSVRAELISAFGFASTTTNILENKFNGENVLNHRLQNRNRTIWSKMTIFRWDDKTARRHSKKLDSCPLMMTEMDAN